MKHIYIIYNPNSTGDSQSNARQLQADLSKQSIDSELVGTERAGHAYQLAKDYSAADTMIVSSSGDGGFNEVVNGVLSSKHPDTVVGLLPSGSANDHYSARHRPGTVDRIISHDIATSDVLKITWGDEVRYAHSYIGLGLSADIGQQLTKHDLNPLLESWLVIRNLFRRRPVRLLIDGRKRRFDSYVCSVVPRMAKYLNLPDDNQRPDGQFTIIVSRTGSFARLIRHLLRLSVSSPEVPNASKINFTVLSKTNLQLDGEVVQLPAASSVTVQCLPGALKNII